MTVEMLITIVVVVAFFYWWMKFCPQVEINSSTDSSASDTVEEEPMQWPSYPNFPWMEWSGRNNIGRDVLYLIETDQQIVLTAVWNNYHKAWFSPGGEEDLEEEYGKVVYYIPVLDHDGDLVIVRNTSDEDDSE